MISQLGDLVQCDRTQSLVGYAEVKDPDQLNPPLRLLNAVKKIRAETADTRLRHGSRWRANSGPMRQVLTNQLSTYEKASSRCDSNLVEEEFYLGASLPYGLVSIPASNIPFYKGAPCLAWTRQML